MNDILYFFRDWQTLVGSFLGVSGSLFVLFLRHVYNRYIDQKDAIQSINISLVYASRHMIFIKNRFTELKT